MSNKTKTNFISASVKKVLSLSLLVTGGVVMSSMALALLLQDTASSNNENVQVWGIQSRVQYLTGMTLSWANSDRIKFEYKEDTNALNFNGAMNLHALVIGSTNQGATGSTVIGGNNNVVKWNWQNAAIIGGNKNTVTNTTTSIIAGATGSHITNVQDSAIFSAEGTIIGSDNTTDTMFIVWGKGHVARGRNTNFIAGSENIQTDQNAQNNVLIGKKIRSNQSNIFVWSNGDTELTPQKGSAFYVNSTSGFGLNTNNPQAALDIANGGLAFNKVYQLSEISDVNVAGVHTVVQKDGKQGVCGYNGSTWVPLTLNAEREGLCTASTQSTPPKHGTSTISGAVQFSGQPVITNGTTLLHQVWSGGMNNNHGGWLNHPWTYKHTGPLDNGDYRCGIGFHMGNPTPDGMKNTDCKACSPITNQRDWRSNGKNDDCDFSCKAGFKKVGRTCTTCEVGTYTTNGTVANSCASCTNKPANAHYTTNGTNANACQWACDAGYHNVGWACKKAIWQKTDTYTCNVAGGKWKDDKIVTTYHCALEENRGVSVPEHICNHWRAKPATTTVVKWDVNCNPPQWETTWNCQNPSCNTSRLPGKCGGATEAVTCIQHKRDRAWNSYETRTQSQQKACTRGCETALCGGANGVATKYQPTALCAAGTASAVGGNASVWSWTCTQLDGAKNCSANRLPLQAGSCGSSHNINHSALNASSANLCNYGAVINFNENTAIYANRWSWKCRGDNGAYNQDANCIAHKPAPQAGQCAQALNTCTVGTVKDTTNIANGKRWSCQGLHGWSTDTTCSLCDNGYIYNSATNRCDPKCGAGFTPSNGKCVKWKCETIAMTGSSGQHTPRQEFHYKWALYERWVDAQWRPCENQDRERKCRRTIINEEGLEVQEPGPGLPIHWIAIEQWPPRPTSMKIAKCIDEQSNIVADELCKTLGNKPSCQQPPHNPPTPPTPPGPPKQQPTPTPPSPKIEVECSTKQAYVCIKGRLSEKSRREKDEWDKEFSQWYYVWWPRGKYCIRAGWTCTPNTHNPSIDDDQKNQVSCHPLKYGPHCDGWAPQLPPWHYQPWRPGSPKN